MSKLPEGWKIERVGNFCDILDNLRVPISSEKRAEIQGDIPYYGANGVQDYINDFIYDETLVLLAEDGGHFNEYQTRPISYMIHGKSWVNNHTHVLRAKNGENKFLLYSLVHKDITSFINGGTRAKLNKGELINIPIATPPLNEQKKIANILSTVDEKISLIDNQIEQTETLKKGLMQKLLTEGIGHGEFKDSEVGRIPVGWGVVRLGDIGSFKNGINKNKDDFGFGNKFFNLLDVFGMNSIKYEPKGLVNITNKELKDFSTKKGDIFFIRSSVKPSGVGLTAVLLYTPIDTVYSGFIIRFRDDKKLDLNFKKYCFYDTEFRKRLLSKSSVSANTNINQEALKSLLIKLPPLKEQKQIAEILSTTDEKLEILRDKKDSFQKLKKGLMQKLLTGEVRVRV